MRTSFSEAALDQLEPELAKLRAEDLDYKSLLLASPYDESFDIDGKFSESIFELIFYENESIKDIAQELDHLLLPRNENIRVVYLTGYSGAGKTTFLHYFMLRRKEEYNCEYLDLNFAEGNGARKRPIEHVISKTIKTKFEDHEIRDVIINIQNNRDILENIFTYGFLECKLKRFL